MRETFFGGGSGHLKSYVLKITETMSCLHTPFAPLTGNSHLKKHVCHSKSFKILKAVHLTRRVIHLDAILIDAVDNLPQAIESTDRVIRRIAQMKLDLSQTRKNRIAQAKKQYAQEEGINLIDPQKSRNLCFRLLLNNFLNVVTVLLLNIVKGIISTYQTSSH